MPRKSLSIGEVIPHFRLRDQNGNFIDSDIIIPQGVTVISFYPKHLLKTNGTQQFRDDYDRFRNLGVNIMVISNDSVKSNRRLVDKHKLPFPVLSDPQGFIRKAFGVPRVMFGLVPGKVTYIVDEEGYILHRYESLFQAGQHVEEAINTIRKTFGSSPEMA